MDHTQISVQLRLPHPGKGEIEIDKCPKNQGFSHSVMADLQRVFGCIDMSLPEGENLDYEYLKIVGEASNSNAFSSKVVMPMSAQHEWRPALGSHVNSHVFQKILFTVYPQHSYLTCLNFTISPFV